MVRVRIENLVKRFGKVVAVDNVNLVVEDHSFTCLLGPSGCGKTTTLRMIAGLEYQDSGSIYFDDRRVDDLLPGERNISMVFQFYAIYPNMSVFDEIAFPLKMMRRPDQEIHERVRKVAERVGLDEVLDQRASKLTVDRKQRIELARAIIREPDLFLFDEPLTNLDTNLRAEMRAETARIQRELSTTTIYVTHDQLEAMSLADRIAVMDRGKLQQYDTAANVYEKPANNFVAGFIGTPPMNFVNCVVQSGDGGPYLDATVFSLKIDGLKTRLANHVGKSVVLGIRPEFLSIQDPDKDDPVRGVVDVVEPLGHRFIINVQVGSVAFKINSVHRDVSQGQEICLGFPPEHTILFDSESGSMLE
jgi:multiple sugar transport system ATP-binding protein